MGLDAIMRLIDGRLITAHMCTNSTSHLTFGVRKLIAYASQFYSLKPGDVIMTGTPAGVGPVVSGDLISLAIDKVGAMQVAVR